MSRRVARAIVLLGCLVLATGAALAHAEVIQKGKLRVAVKGQLSPRTLPRSDDAPVSVSVSGNIATLDHSDPPQLETLRIELNRHGRIDYTGLPICRYDQIQPASTSRALAACRPSLVGQGHFAADIVLAGQQPYPSQGRLLLFNSRLNGRPVLLGQIYAPRPFATSFVITFTMHRLEHGPFGTVLTAQLPSALGSWGYVTSIEMVLSRRYSYRGGAHSYVSATCPAAPGFSGASFPLAHVSFGFAGSIELDSTLNRDCKAA
jgi:hypothetical protein